MLGRSLVTAQLVISGVVLRSIWLVSAAAIWGSWHLKRGIFLVLPTLQ
jgi:hypothetical protein